MSETTTRIAQELRTELKDAMRSRDQNRIDVVRQVETEVSKAKTAPGFKGEVDDALYLEVIAAYSKRMTKAIKEYEGVERGKEMVEKLTFEVEFLSRWLPSKLDAEQTRALVREAIAELGIDSPKMAGRLVGHLMKTHGKDALDGGLVNKLAREELGGG